MSAEEDTGPPANAVPGRRLGLDADYIAGPGTYVHRAHIYASVVGAVVVEEEMDEDETKPMIMVLAEQEQSVVPKEGSTVTAKVTRVNPRLASVQIMCVEGKALKDVFAGIVRKQDVRAMEIDKVEIYNSFRPGDIILAKVISLGDSRSYYLSTAANDLGVVYARSVAGEPLVAISWQEMQCPKTKMIEQRKVAKLA